MAEGKDIAWKPILGMVGTGLAGIAIGAFLVAPMIKKAKEKKLASKKKDDKKSTASSTTKTT